MKLAVLRFSPFRIYPPILKLSYLVPVLGRSSSSVGREHACNNFRGTRLGAVCRIAWPPSAFVIPATAQIGRSLVAEICPNRLEPRVLAWTDRQTTSPRVFCGHVEKPLG